MAVWPSYARIVKDGYSEQDGDVSVLRTEMERGVPKQAAINGDVLAEITCSVYFFSASDSESFDTWWKDDVGRVGWFAMAHPRTGVTTQFRFKEGGRGTLNWLAGSFAVCSRTGVTLEYVA